jgi:hypothetical protein
MRLKSAEYRQEKGEQKSAVAEWVGGFPCRGQEAPQRALGELSLYRSVAASLVSLFIWYRASTRSSAI